MHTRFLLSLLSVALLTASCQKIDLDDLNRNGSSSKTDTSSTTKDDGQDNSGSGLQEQPDGTQLLPAEEHVIALRTAIDDNTDQLLYISLYEWNNIPSANSANGSTKATELAASYVEGNITGWRIPTKLDWQQLRELYYGYKEDHMPYLCDTLQSLNTRIKSLGGTPLRAWQLKDNFPGYRYLCDDATYSYSLLENTNATKGGTTVKYNLRLVKDSIVTIP